MAEIVETVSPIWRDPVWCYEFRIGHVCDDVEWQFGLSEDEFVRSAMLELWLDRVDFGDGLYRRDFHMVSKGEWKLTAIVWQGRCERCGRVYQAWSWKFGDWEADDAEWCHS